MSIWRVNQEHHVVHSLRPDFKTAQFKGDKEEMATDMIEEPASSSFYCVGYHFFLVSLRYKRIEQFQNPGTMNAQHGVPGSLTIYSPLYPRLVFSLCYQDYLLK